MKAETRKMLLAFARTAITDPAEREAAVLALQPRGDERPDKMLNTRAAAEFLGVSRRTLRSYKASGLIHPIKVTKRTFRWSRNALASLLANGSV